jgi:hypothetical protein
VSPTTTDDGRDEVRARVREPIAPFPSREQLAEFAKEFEVDGFHVARCSVREPERALYLQLDLPSAGGDQYGCVKRVITSGLLDAFPNADILSVSVCDDAGAILKVTAYRAALGALSPQDRDLPGRQYCDRFQVEYDRQARHYRED